VALVVRGLALFIALALPVSAQSAHLPRLAAPHAGQRIVVIAPHIDDEGLAAAGYASDAVAAGASVYIIYLTAGDHSRTMLAANRLTFFAAATLNKKGERRLREGRHAADSIGLPESNLILLGYPDRGLRRMLLRPDHAIRSASTGKSAVPYPEALSPGAPYKLESLLTDLESLLENIQPDVVIAPDDQDHHPDHRAAAVLTARVLAETGLTPARLGYVIHARSQALTRAAASGKCECVVYPLGPETLKRKIAMLASYRSQRRSPYLHMLFMRSMVAAREIFVRYGS
jgi:LmbE family N-acetylglucosaminyl deacetylase